MNGMTRVNGRLSLEEGDVRAMCGDFTKVVKGQWQDPTGADVTITTESCIGRGVPLTQRALCEEENEQAGGRLRNGEQGGWLE